LNSVVLSVKKEEIVSEDDTMMFGFKPGRTDGLRMS